MESRFLDPHRLGKIASVLAACLLAACGGSGGYPEAAPYKNNNVDPFASFETGVGGVTVLNSSLAASTTAATVATSTTNTTDGSSSMQVTLNDATAWVGFASFATTSSPNLSDWSGHRTFLVDVNSTSSIAYGDLNLRLQNRAGASCIIPVTQVTDVVAGAETTLAFRLNWKSSDCLLDGSGIAAAYVELGGGTANTPASNIVYVDNMRLTKAKQVMALGDSITGSSGCWRKYLWDTLKADGFANIDMVGIRNNTSECGSDWDGDVSAFGGMSVTTVNAPWDSAHPVHVGLAAADRGDSVFTYSATPAVVPGNLAVWLEKTRPEVVAMNLATNDLWTNVSIGNILAGYDTMLAQIRASNPKMRLVAAKINFEPTAADSVCSINGNPCAERSAAFNLALETWVACNSTSDSPITIADLTVGWNTTTMTSDGVHPNANGAQVMAANWKTAVESALSTLDTAGPAPAACPADIKDGTVTTSGTVTTAELTSFKYGVGGFQAYKQDNTAAASTDVTVTNSTTGATDGAHSAQLTVTHVPPGSWAGIGAKSNGGVSDWTPYKQLKVDVTAPAGGSDFTGVVMVQSGAPNWAICQSSISPLQSVAAGTTGTLTLDLTGCPSGFEPTNVFMIQVGTWTVGTFYFDHFRLTNEVVVVAATDSANGSTSTSGGVTTALLTSFKTGVSGFSVYEWDANSSWALADITGSSGASVTVERSNSNTYATEGNSSAAVTVPSTSGNSYYFGFVPAVTDWSSFDTIKFDVQTAVTYWWPQMEIWYSNDTKHCTVAGNANATTSLTAPSTIAIPLSSCAADLAGATVSHVTIYQQNGYGTAHYDNIRLTGGTSTVTDIADAATGTNTTDGSYTEITSFKTGLGRWTILANTGQAPVGSSTVTLDSSSNGSDGTYSAKLSQTATLGTDGAVGPALSYIGAQNWSGYSTQKLKFDVTIPAGGSNFDGVIVLQSGTAWHWCTSAVKVTASSTTVVTGTGSLDLSTCTNAGDDLTAVYRISLLNYSTSVAANYYIDNVRLATQ